MTQLPIEEYQGKPVIVLSEEASAKLPSRGMVMAEVVLNTATFRLPLEPNGKNSHWFLVPESIRKVTGARIGDTVSITITPVNEWTEPNVPADVRAELEKDPQMLATWNDITPAARWDWVRWVSAPKQTETRKRRVESIASRMRDGKRRPCCFDRTKCTLTV